jgi:hypothetical protein
MLDVFEINIKVFMYEFLLLKRHVLFAENFKKIISFYGISNYKTLPFFQISITCFSFRDLKKNCIFFSMVFHTLFMKLKMC